LSSVSDRPRLQRWQRLVFGAVAALVLLGPARLGAAGPEPEEAGAVEPAVDSQRSFTVRFEGNRFLGDRALRAAAVDELGDFHRLGRSRADADDAAFQMEGAYRREGFAFATVAFALTPAALTFTVTEGPRVRLGELRLAGNSAYPSEVLLGFFDPQSTNLLGLGRRWFVKTEIEAGVSGLRDYYYANGYTQVVVEPPTYTYSADRSTVDVVVEVREGQRQVVSAVRFAGDMQTAMQADLDALAADLTGQPYYPRRKLQVRSAVLEQFGNLGYPDAQVRVEDRPGEAPGEVVLEAVLTSGPLVTIGEVTVARTGKTREQFLRNRLELAPGERYDRQKERSSFRELYQTGLFTQVDLALEETAVPERRNLRVAVVEGPSREVFFEPGWGSYERLRARTGFREKNLFGTGRIARAEAGASLLSTDALVGLTDPWFLQTRITADFPVVYKHREEPSFTREEVSLSALFSRPLSDTVTATGGYSYRATRQLHVKVDTTEIPADGSYNLGSLKGQLTYDTRDDLFFPSRGQRHFVSLEYASRQLGGSIGFTRATAGLRGFVPLTASTTLGLRCDSGLMVPSAQDVSVPLAERFFNGGERTVRSFQESELGPRDASGDPVGGLGYNLLNLELRQRLFGNLAGSLFFDYGNVSPNASRADRGLPPYRSRDEVVSDTLDQYFQDFRPGVGFGLQYLSPVGPARLDFAFNPSARIDEGERRFVWHFSVGMAF